ncbi:MAG: hypothetical protein DCF23_00095 [Cyanobium sp.]|nr:MAG: hypothetical protein DCF23_00095 [Cyanobium sp.]
MATAAPAGGPGGGASPGDRHRSAAVAGPAPSLPRGEGAPAGPCRRRGRLGCAHHQGSSLCGRAARR